MYLNTFEVFNNWFGIDKESQTEEETSGPNERTDLIELMEKSIGIEWSWEPGPSSGSRDFFLQVVIISP